MRAQLRHCWAALHDYNTRFRAALRLSRLHVVMVCLIGALIAVGGHPSHRALGAREPVADPQLAWVNFVYQLVIAVVMAVISYALTPKPPKPKPAALSEFDVPQAREGQSYCWIFGECYVPDATVAAWDNLTNQPIKAKGKK